MNKDQTGFRGIHPVTALLFIAFAFTVSMASTHPLILAADFICAAAGDIFMHRKKAVRLLFCAILPMLILISLFNCFYNHYGVTILFVMKNGNNVTAEALFYGLVFATKACATVLWLDFNADVLQSDKVIFLFGRISPRLALVISMVLRFLPLIRRQSAEIHAAQTGLGLDTGKHLFLKIKSAAHRLSILVSWTLERGIDTSDSMRARGYGVKRRSFYNRFSFSPGDLLITVVVSSAFVAYLLTFRGFASVYNPVITIPSPSVFGWIAFLLVLISLLLPAVFECITMYYFHKELHKRKTAISDV